MLTSIEIKINKDNLDITTSISYDFINLLPDKTIGLYVGNDLLLEVVTDKSGNASGSLDTIAESFLKALTCLSTFSVIAKNIPKSGIIFGITSIVEDEEDSSRNGKWTLEVRYD